MVAPRLVAIANQMEQRLVGSRSLITESQQTLNEAKCLLATAHEARRERLIIRELLQSHTHEPTSPPQPRP